MQDLTLVIPAKHESESLPIFLNELSSFDCKKLIVLEETDLKTINSIKHFQDIIIVFQKKGGYGDALLEGIRKTKKINKSVIRDSIFGKKVANPL